MDCRKPWNDEQAREETTPPQADLTKPLSHVQVGQVWDLQAAHPAGDADQSVRNLLDYTWHLTLDDGSVVEQYDDLGEEVLFDSVDLARVRKASWVPTSCLRGEVVLDRPSVAKPFTSSVCESAQSATCACAVSHAVSHATSVLVEPGQTPILFRRHRVKGDSDTVVMYGLGVREGEREAVMLIDPGGGVLLAW